MTLKLINSFLIIFCCVGCQGKLSKENKTEITNKIDLTTFNKYCDLIEISKLGSEEKGDMFTIKKFVIKIHVKNNCFINLSEGFAVNELLFCGQSQADSFSHIFNLVKKEINAGDTITVNGILFSNEKEKNKEFINEKSNCLYYFIPDKPIVNEIDSCKLINTIFDLGLTPLYYSNNEVFNEVKNKFDKNILKDIDKMGFFFRGYNLSKSLLFKQHYIEHNYNSQIYNDGLFYGSRCMFKVAENQYKNCNLTIRLPKNSQSK